MLSKKVLPVVVAVIVGLSFWAYRSLGSDGDGLTRQQKLLYTIGYLLEQKHYDPKKIDDNFSKAVFNKYLVALDPDKYIFLKQDIDALKKYETYIDDEIHGATIEFIPAAGAIYAKRLEEVTGIYKKILESPFDYTIDESVLLEADSLDFPANEQAREDIWRKRLKYLSLERYVELLDQKEKSKDTAAIRKKSDKELEAEARDKVLKLMNRNFERLKKKLTEDQQFNMYVNTITAEMDPHTDFMPPIEKRAFDEEMSNKFYGIGAQLREEDGYTKVVSILPGSPASKNGQIEANDIIVKVAEGNAEPVDITGYILDDAVKLIRGTKDSEVRLTLKKSDGSMKVVSLIRDKIVQDEAGARSLVINNDGKKIGYIYLPEFYSDFENKDGAHCAKDVAKELQKLKAENIQGLIFDLRFNGGGSLYEVVQMIGLFIKNGPVVQVKDKDETPAVLSDNSTHLLYDGPLVVMVNEFSASASEIFAGAIQDYKRGLIVGSTSTLGKGTVQKTLPLGNPSNLFGTGTDYGALKLTFEKFYRINGESTQLKGVKSDIVIPDSYEYLKIREKDYLTALPWDTIPSATYTPWVSNVDMNAVIKKSTENIVNNPAFQTIKKSSEWLNQNSDKKYSLNITQYKEDMKKLNNIVKEVDSVKKLSKDMNVTIATADKDMYYNNPDKGKGERYQEWLKRLKADIYVDQTSRIVTEMINQKTAVADNKK